MTIVTENALAGTAAWWEAPHAPPAAIEGFSTETSVVASDVLELCVSTQPAARYAGQVFRLGWYAGLGGRHVQTLSGNVGLPRYAPPPDPVTGYCRAEWPVTDHVHTSEEWPSGLYVVVLELASGPHAGTALRIPFVVRQLPGERPPILVQMPVNTSQAYNHWGGKSLYDSSSTDRVAAVKVSFDRPRHSWDERAARDGKLANLNSREPFVYELPLVRWLEREGFEVAYQTNVDTHRDPSSLWGPRVIMTAGHDEYWTREMRDGFDDALARGVGLAFMGANTCYWQVRYEDGERTLVEYRRADTDPEPDPALKTVRFRDLTPPRPERELIGQQYEGGLVKPRDARAFSFVPSFAGDAWAAGIELDSSVPLERLVGYEWDTFEERAVPPGCVRILHCDGPDVAADCIRWTAPSGARVFSSGSLGFSWGLDDWASPGTADARVQRLMRNGLSEMLA